MNLLIGYGWATVDLDRARQEAGLGDADPAWQPADEPPLGARALRADLRAGSLVLLEPSSEGKLAAWLARHGEGVAVVYHLADPSAADPGRGAATAFGSSGTVRPIKEGRYEIIVARHP